MSLKSQADDEEETYEIFPIRVVDFIGKDFELSEKYNYDPDWIIVNNGDELENIRDDVLYNAKYIYIKEYNMVMCDAKEYTDKAIFTFEIKYKDFNKLADRKILNTNNGYAFGFSYYDWGVPESLLKRYAEDRSIFVIQSPKLAYSNVEKYTITVKKKLNGFKDKKECFVGLFETEDTTKTDVIEKINIVNGEGVAIFNVSDRTKKYYVYEVDSDGNKLQNVDNLVIEYKNNVVDFSKAIYTKEGNISSDKKVVSSLYSLENMPQRSSEPVVNII